MGDSSPTLKCQTPQINIGIKSNQTQSTEQLCDPGDSSTLMGVENPVFTFEDPTEEADNTSYIRDDMDLTEEENICDEAGLEEQRLSMSLVGNPIHSLAVPENRVTRRGSTSSNASQDSINNGKLKPLDMPTDSKLTPNLLSPATGTPGSVWNYLSESRRGSDISSFSGMSSFTSSNYSASNISHMSSSLSERLISLRRAFSSRTEKVKQGLSQPPSPTLSGSLANSGFNSLISTPERKKPDAASTKSVLDAILEPKNKRLRLGSFVPALSQASDNNFADVAWVGVGRRKFKKPKWLQKCRIPITIEAQSKLYILWMAIVTVAFTYNAVAIPLRGFFPYQTPENVHEWLIADYVADGVYLLDIIFVQPRIRFIEHGVDVKGVKDTIRNYVKSRKFKVDICSLMPLDLFYFLVGVNPWLRVSRILKIQSFWEFFERCDQAVRSGFALRISKTMFYMLYLIHLEGCGYYAASVYEGIGTNPWVYSGTGNAYIRCFYLAAKTATSIGNNPKPLNEFEFIFMTIYWLSGVFVFALLVGQIRDIVDSVTKNQDEHRKKVNDIMRYMKRINLPKDIQGRVRTWFNYNWEQQKALDENAVLESLPRALKTDLAISVNFQTLNKVQIFQDCDKSLLFTLVLKLKPVLYLNDDFICRKGEVGKEMYIVSQGVVDVLGGKDSKQILATLREGSVFGEISLLGLSKGGGNRRTADIKCRGFTNLFILSKSDFEQAMRDYPEAHKMLKHRAKKLIKINEKIEQSEKENEIEEIIKAPNETPKLIRTAIKIMQVRKASLFKQDEELDEEDDLSAAQSKDMPSTSRRESIKSSTSKIRLSRRASSQDSEDGSTSNIRHTLSRRASSQDSEDGSTSKIRHTLSRRASSQESEEDAILREVEQLERERKISLEKEREEEMRKISVTDAEINEVMNLGRMEDIKEESVISLSSFGDNQSERDKQCWTPQEETHESKQSPEKVQQHSPEKTSHSEERRSSPIGHLSLTEDDLINVLSPQPPMSKEGLNTTKEGLNTTAAHIRIQPVTPVNPVEITINSPVESIGSNLSDKIPNQNQFICNAEIHYKPERIISPKPDYWSDEKNIHGKPTAKVLPLVKVSQTDSVKGDEAIDLLEEIISRELSSPQSGENKIDRDRVVRGLS